MVGGIGLGPGLLGMEQVDELILKGGATPVAPLVGRLVAGAVEVSGAGRHLGR